MGHVQRYDIKKYIPGKKAASTEILNLKKKKKISREIVDYDLIKFPFRKKGTEVIIFGPKQQVSRRKGMKKVTPN